MLVGRGAAVRCDSIVDRDEDRDYSKTNTSPAHILQTRRVNEKIPTAIVDRLRSLDDVKNHPGTRAMIDLIRRICKQQWTHFTLRYDQDAPRVDLNSPKMQDMILYDEAVFTREELVEDMIQFAVFHEELIDCYGINYELFWVRSSTTAQLDTRMVAFMQDLCSRANSRYKGKKPRELVMREWQKMGTWETLSASHIVPQEDLAEDREEGRGYPLRNW